MKYLKLIEQGGRKSTVEWEPRDERQGIPRVVTCGGKVFVNSPGHNMYREEPTFHTNASLDGWSEQREGLQHG